MSFWSTLGKDLKIVGQAALAIEPIAATAIGIVNPALGVTLSGITGRITSSIAAVEQTITEAKAGALKSQTVIADFQAGLAMAEEITGHAYAYDQAALQAVIDAQTAAFNAMAAFKNTIKQQ